MSHEEKKPSKKQFYQRWWFWVTVVIIWLFVNPRGCIIVNKTPGETTAPTTTQSKIPDPPKDPRSMFVFEMSNTGISEDAAGRIYDLLATELQCVNISFVEKSNVGNALYIIDEKNYRMTIAADDDGIYSVRCGSYEMYDGENVIYTIKDIKDRDTSKNKEAYGVIAKEIVLNCLKSPSTAKFPWISEFSMQRNGDTVAVSGYVDSENSFGAMIRAEWVVQFRVINLKAFEYEVLYIWIDGESTGEFVELD